MKIQAFTLVVGIAFTLFASTFFVGCGHHKRYKSEYHITHCAIPCDNGQGQGQGHNKHDCHEGHQDEG